MLLLYIVPILFRVANLTGLNCNCSGVHAIKNVLTVIYSVNSFGATVFDYRALSEDIFRLD